MPPLKDDAEVFGVPGEEHGHLTHVVHSAVAGHGAVIHCCVVRGVVHLYCGVRGCLSVYKSYRG